MKTLKRTMVALLALLPLATGMAFADTEYGYSRLFVFGASFLDPGNQFAVTGETAHPPFDPNSFLNYGVGGHHFSNGRTWVEVMAQEMELTEWAKPAYRDPAFGNYAYGYARAREVDNAIGPSLGDQVQAWIDNGHCTGAAMNDTLFVVDSAYADFLDIFAAPPDQTMDIVNGMINSIALNIFILHECGARNLLVPNIADIGASPMVIGEQQKEAATILSRGYNLAVQAVVDAYSGWPFDMNIKTVDLFAATTAMVAMPESFGLTNVTDTCVTPYVVKNAFCQDRDGYFFWDPLHPTKKVHELFAAEALAALQTAD